MSRRRWLIFAVALVAVVGVGHATGLHERVTVQGLRSWVADAGPWGILLFLGAFAASSLISLPAIAFILAALVAYGQGTGLAVGFVGGLLAATTSFLVVRAARGRQVPDATPAPRHRWVERILGALGEHPVVTVAVLRVLFVLSGPVNLALGLSRVRFRHYLAGTALGLVPPLLFYSATLSCWVG